MDSVEKLYKNVALYYNISVEELLDRLTKNGEPLIHNYYKEVYPNGF